jgi:LPXTG-motif cell wall-anchored protein
MRRDHLGRRLVAAVALLVGVLLATPGISSAAPYPAPQGTGTVSSGTVTIGGSVRFSGDGFLPGEPIDIGMGYANSGGQLDATTASLTGTFSIVVTPPMVGDAVLIAIGNTSGRQVTAAIRVLAVGGSGNGSGSGSGSGTPRKTLPVTGTRPIAPIALGGAAMLLFGAALVGVTRRRRPAMI